MTVHLEPAEKATQLDSLLDRLVAAAFEPRDTDPQMAAMQDARDQAAARGDFDKAGAHDSILNILRAGDQQQTTPASPIQRNQERTMSTADQAPPKHDPLGLLQTGSFGIDWDRSPTHDAIMAAEARDREAAAAAKEQAQNNIDASRGFAQKIADQTPSRTQDHLPAARQAEQRQVEP